MDDYGTNLAWSQIVARQDRLEDRIEVVEDKVEAIPTLIRSNERLTTAVYSVGGLVVVAAVGQLLLGGGA